MYKFIRSLLFLLPPEVIHHIIKWVLKFGFKIPGIKEIVLSYFCVKDNRLERNIWGIKFKNPVGLAAGFDKNGEIVEELSAFGFGFIEIGTITPRPQRGNPKPRLFRLVKDRALINRMGMNNVGVDKVVNNIEKVRKNKIDIIIGANISKNSDTTNENAVNDYVECFVKLYELVDFFVINVSCPNVKSLTSLQDKDNLNVIISRLAEIRKEKDKYRPILIKVSPDIEENQIKDIIDVINKNYIDGVVATNTTLSRQDLKTDYNKIEKIGYGGLSGAPLMQKSNRIIEIFCSYNITTIASGGIIDEHDALKKISMGAVLVEVYTGFIYTGPAIAKKINKYILIN